MDKFDELEMKKFEAILGEFKEKEINLWEYWAMFWKRKWLIFVVTIVVIGFAVFKSYTTNPTYKASGILSIEREPNILSFEDMFQFETSRNEYLETQYRILQSRTLASEVIDRLNGSLYESILVTRKKRENLPSEAYLNLKGQQIDLFLDNMEVEPIENTWLVEVSFTADGPKLSSDIVNTLFDAFIEMDIRNKYAATEEAAGFLETEINRLKGEIDRKVKELQKYGVEKDIVALSDEETTIIDKLGDLNSALTKAQIERVNKETTYNEIKGASADYVPEAITNPLIQQLRKDYVALNRELAKKQEQWGPEYPEIQRLNTEIGNIKQQLDRETNNWIRAAYADYQAALVQVKSLEKVFNEQKQEAFKLKSNAILYNSLKIEIDNANSMLESLMRRASETSISARMRGMKTSNIKVVDKAEVPLSPFKPNKKKNIIMGLFIGLLGGLGLAYLFDHMDNSIKTSKDVEKFGQFPTLGIVPAYSSNGFTKGYGHGDEEENQTIDSIELISHFSPKSSYSESYRSIRAALLLSSADKDLKVLAVSSPYPKEGKSATVSNLAVTLAQTGHKVLLVDSDLRKPSLHNIFMIKNSNGLTNYLTSDMGPNELIKTTSIENLFVINAGPVPPNPAELLNSTKMSQLIKSLKQIYDYVLFDTPPILVVSDALVLSSKLDGMILVVRGEKTTGEALKRTKEKLEMAKVRILGAIINNLKIRRYDYYNRDNLYYRSYEKEREGLEKENKRSGTEASFSP